MTQWWKRARVEASVTKDVCGYNLAMVGGSCSVHRVVALVNAPQGAFELGCVAEVFGTPRESIPTRYELTVCAESPGRVPTTAGVSVTVERGLSELEAADTIVIPGWRPPDAAVSDSVLDALRVAHARGCRIVTICSGVFALARTGLLDGRRATTHWAATARLQTAFPDIDVDPDALYVDHGDVATSAGAGAGIDLCLHLVRTDQGAAYADRIARHMVLPPYRQGGQTQFAMPLQSPTPQPSLAEVLNWVGERLDEPIRLADMATQLRVSTRTLARRFTEQLGVSPGQWLLAQRVARAQILLETTDLPVDVIARRVGLVSATNLRRRFHAATQTTPAAYRRSFRAAAGGTRG
ncbi:DJ-1/PfpI family protein [Mycobacterium sp. MYCO198283]|uniref:GlxA family transcriptional regulator n=1 Tax=Mycobacterium sp. MYCO198283 TaxID=2883505 RepID=UPI001E4368BD|nr:helix-turn-helix domain-containing protein [Mycobacterium sp. MYCO198283]MCG5433345.1 DJ-1/PfpI family protein [Mycobacterium sp. MYCO198283]